MHSVKRVEEEPESLKNNKVEWTKELIKQLEANKGKLTNVKEKYKNLYKQEDVKKSLAEMYGDLCCYCEGNVPLTGYAEIEHYKPKSEFPELCFEWTNLHQICTRCNKKKNDKWDSDFPILSPTDDKIEEHLYFKDILLLCKEDDKRAKNSINHLKLNNEVFLNYRTKLLEIAKNFSKRPEKDKECFKELIFVEENYPTYRKYLVSIVEGKEL